MKKISVGLDCFIFDNIFGNNKQILSGSLHLPTNYLQLPGLLIDQIGTLIRRIWPPAQSVTPPNMTSDDASQNVNDSFF